MKKLKLDLDDLTVEAFETVEARASEGTVVGHAPTFNTLQCAGTCYISCNYSKCEGWDSCDASCATEWYTNCTRCN